MRQKARDTVGDGQNILEKGIKWPGDRKTAVNLLGLLFLRRQN